MNKITDVRIISKFVSPLDNKICGIYEAKFEGKTRVFIENNNTMAVVTHLLDKPANDCLMLIRNDIQEELTRKLNELK